MITAQDKILHVASKLGLSSLQNMQASTGAVYDADIDINNQIFSNASRHVNPGVTNVNQNEFEVNEALLIETIAFYTHTASGEAKNFQLAYGSNAIIVFDLIIGNKRVMKDTPIFAAGSPFTFANVANFSQKVGVDNTIVPTFLPRHQVYMEGSGILIPPQVQWSVNYQLFDVVTGAVIPVNEETGFIGCYLFGTRVLLNFNTSI